MLLHDIVENRARRDGSRVALVVSGQTVTFEELGARSRRLAVGLREIAAPGDRVALLAKNCREYTECYYGVPRAQMILCLLNYRLAVRELIRIVEDAGAKVLLATDEYLPTASEVAGAVSSVETIVVIGSARGAPPSGHRCLSYEDLIETGTENGPEAPRGDERAPAWLIYTSGTTGRPKGALLSHKNLLAAATNAILGSNRPEGPVLFPWPLCHVAGDAVLHAHLLGQTLVLMEKFEAGAALRLLGEHRCTSLTLAPTMLVQLLEHDALPDADLAQLERVTYGSSAMPPAVLDRAMAAFPDAEFGTVFGMTELSGNVTFLDGAAHREARSGCPERLRSVGRPQVLAAVRVVDADLRDVAAGEVGELVVQGDQVMVGYWGDPAATAEAMTGGWFHTGDLATWDSDGYLYMVDRKKDMILTGGENVYSREVEDILYECPEILHAAVVGVPDERWGEMVAAVVERKPGSVITAEAVVAHCRTLLAGYKCPRRVEFVVELPRNASGKVLKQPLRRWLVEAAPKLSASTR